MNQESPTDDPALEAAIARLTRRQCVRLSRAATGAIVAAIDELAAEAKHRLEPPTEFDSLALRSPAGHDAGS
jgi:hypothetical protein